MEETTIIAGTAVAMDAGPFAGKSAASWPSIFAGAFVAASATVTLVALGSGIGFASISPWSGHGVSVATFAVSTAIWLIVTQWIAAALGGHISGRLRTRWVGTHTHEVFFRDTAHGLIAWAVATILVAVVAAGSVFSAAGIAAIEARAEATHIVANAFASGSMPDTDRTYLAEQVAARTGASRSEAQARVDDLTAAVMQSQEELKADAKRRHRPPSIWLCRC